MLDEQMKKCMQLCRACGDICEETFYNYCLAAGGAHVAQAHARLMADCAEVCRTSANAMARGSELHAEICATCAVVCEACADSCAAMKGDKDMQACAEACRACAASCSEMSRGSANDTNTLRATRAG